MRTIITTLALTGTLAIGLCGCYRTAEKTDPGKVPADGDVVVEVEATCVCEAGKAGETVWCTECSKGYVDGTEKGCEDCVKSKLGGPDCPT